MIEDRLAETLDRVAAAAPDEAGGFDRFLRRRARRTRRTAAATALCLSLVLVLAVALLDPPWGRSDPAASPALRPAEQAHWKAGPLVTEAPLQGFQIAVPAGWEVNQARQGLELRPGSEDLRRQLPTPIQVGTFALDPADHPQGAELFRDNNGFLGDISGRIGEFDTRTSGTFGGGRWWLRTDGGAPGERTTVWYTSWPYHCQGGEPCPDVLALRTLRVALVGAGDRVRTLAMQVVPELLRTARPITNALDGQAHATRPACVDGVTARPSVDIFPVGRTPTTVRITWTFRTSSALIPCHFRRLLELAFLSNGRPVTVAGDGKRVLEGNLPEGSVLAPGVVGVEWRWTNWCGGDVQIRFHGARVSASDPPPGDRLAPSTPPSCADPSRPTRLRVVEWGA